MRADNFLTLSNHCCAADRRSCELRSAVIGSIGANRQLEAVLAELHKLERSIGELEDDLGLPRSPENTPLDLRVRRICERLTP
jgi:hypothetical protein